jgi:hypothetical protein
MFVDLEAKESREDSAFGDDTGSETSPICRT